MSKWPTTGSFEHGVQVGAKQMVDHLWNLIARKNARFDQLANRVGELHDACKDGAYYSMPLSYKTDEAAKIGGEGVPDVTALRARVSALTRRLAEAEHDRDLHQNLSERLKLALRMPGTGSYVEWGAACRDAVDRLAEAEEAIREADDLLTSVMGEAWSSGARIDDELSARKEWIKKPAVLRALGEIGEE